VLEQAYTNNAGSELQLQMLQLQMLQLQMLQLQMLQLQMLQSLKLSIVISQTFYIIFCLQMEAGEKHPRLQEV